MRGLHHDLDRDEPFSAGRGLRTDVSFPVESLADAEATACLAQARLGNAEAFCRLAAMHEERLYRQAVAMCGDLHHAEDLVAETMIEAWRSLVRHDGTCRFSTWLYAILLHRHQKWLRRLRSRPILSRLLPRSQAEQGEASLLLVADLAPTAVEQLIDRETARRLRSAIARLPETQQSVVRLRFYEGASLAGIAAALGLPLGTVKSRLHHALARLRELDEVMNLFDDRRDTGT